ncbi:MAG: L,D-transpeptidase family protein [Solirubrobacteraceae bacterium]|nr:L,D-transpeptidase family protein [Solirubrobacteraceae bacterium]
MIRTLALTTVLGAAALPVASAVAQSPAPTTTTPVPAVEERPEPKQGKITLRTERPMGLVQSRVKVRGTLTPYVAGQKVIVRFYRGAKKLRVVEVSVKRDGKVGRFTVGYAPKKTGRLTVRAVHRETDELASITAKGVGVDVLPRRVAPGAKGATVRIMQEHLDRLGYVVGKRGVFDARTARAVLAFRKVTGMARTSQANEEVFARIARGGGRFKVKFPKHGRHVEADISRQVLALIGANGKVERIYPTSTGAPATPTILGSFKVYRKDQGTNAIGMVHSAYFIRGYAIHGYKSVPTYNASHGCLRVPIPDAMNIFRWVRYGTRVDTYR